jgi:dipeptidyl aminopeptidase/acylaminoacyl peptidase
VTAVTCEHRSDAALAGTAILALVAAILACRPAFSPDGRRILYAAKDAATGAGCIAVYDRESRTAKVVFATDPADQHPPMAQWTDDGKQAIVLLPKAAGNAGDKGLAIAIVDLDGERPVLRRMLRGIEQPTDSLVAPVPILGGRLYFGGKTLMRLDLRDGTALRRDLPAGSTDCVLRRAGDVVYAATLLPGTPKRLAVGRLDPETLAVTTAFEQAAGEPWSALPMPAISPDGERIAVAAANEGQTEWAILVYAHGKREATLTIPGEHVLQVGNIEWMPDNTTMWAVVMRAAATGASIDYSVVEIDVAGNTRREIELLRIAKQGDKQDPASAFLFQFAIAPDGSMLALTTAFLEPVEPEQCGLILVDLAGRVPVTQRIAFPRADGTEPTGK